MFAMLNRIFKPLDTADADAAIADAAQSSKDVGVRARALRMDISCGSAATIAGIACAVVENAEKLLHKV